MYQSAAIEEAIVETAVAAIASGDTDLLSALNALQAPIYVTDASGLITHFNDACVGFTGRIPAVGKDRWCVTWKLYTDDGAFLPHDQCPMATAILERRRVRGVTAVAERPDGTRVNFRPFPTPIFDVAGELAGAVNILIDITEIRQIEALQEQAQRCRRLARGVTDSAAARTLNLMAMEYEAKALGLQAALAGPTQP